VVVKLKVAVVAADMVVPLWERLGAAGVPGARDGLNAEVDL
jgi:hypothetical protein